MNKKKVLIAGDVMLDKYITGSVTRISPEAPIPVLHQSSISYHPGGAANLALNLVNLGIEVDLVSTIGSDEEGEILKKLCQGHGINAKIYYCEGVTITKTRVISRNQQMLRIDREDEPDLYGLLEVTPSDISISSYDLILVSDYGKGFCTDSLIKDIISEAGKFSIPVFIDPKGKNWAKYKGSSFIKPNVSELSDFLGVPALLNENVIAMVRESIQSLSLQQMIISRAHEGLTLINGDKVENYQAPHVDVYDVSGAGDTTLAVISYGILNGYSMEESLALAVKCGSFVVTKSKTYAITAEDLNSILQND